jgi:hypothetical protein
VFVRALEALARVAEQQGAGCEQFPSRRRVVLKAACGDYYNREVRMMFFEGAIVRATGAEHVGNGPARAACEPARSRITRRSVPLAARHSLFEFNRNFCQES